jgi:hypothetical protein
MKHRGAETDLDLFIRDEYIPHGPLTSLHRPIACAQSDQLLSAQLMVLDTILLSYE